MTQLLYILPVILLATWEALEFRGKKLESGLVKFVWLGSFLLFIDLSTWLLVMAFYACLFDPFWNIAAGQPTGYIGKTKIPDKWFRKIKMSGIWLSWARFCLLFAIVVTIIYRSW